MEKNEKTQAQSIDALIRRLDALEAENAVLKATVDPNDYASASMRTGDADQRKKARLRLIDGKPVIKWDDMKTNSVRIVNGREEVEQVAKFYFLDGTSEEIDFRELQHRMQPQPYTSAYPIDAVETSTKGTFLTLELPDGKTLKIQDTFVN